MVRVNEGLEYVEPSRSQKKAAPEGELLVDFSTGY